MLTIAGKNGAGAPFGAHAPICGMMYLMSAADTAGATRSDSRRNRARLVAEARQLLASRGVDVSLREIARAAEVGVGTLYRHFPTREELVDAVLEDAFEELTTLAEQALTEPDAWAGLRRFLEQALALHARNRGLKDVVETQIHGRERAAAVPIQRSVRRWRFAERRACTSATLNRSSTPRATPACAEPRPEGACALGSSRLRQRARSDRSRDRSRNAGRPIRAAYSRHTRLPRPPASRSTATRRPS